MKRKLRWIFLILGIVVAGGMGYAYWQIRNLDPEGGCMEAKYWSLCERAWQQSLMVGLSWGFRTLPTDQEMIASFVKNRSDFDAMVGEIARDEYSYMTLLNKKWEEKYGIFMAQAVASYPQTPEEKRKHIMRTWAYSFSVAGTRYVKDATSSDMAYLLRDKSYVYFRSPPQIVDGYVLSLPDANSTQVHEYRILKSLDGPPWPSDWTAGRCWLRPIEPQWFLALCRDRVGG